MESQEHPKILIADTNMEIPQVDRLAAPWWTSLPLVSSPYELVFHASQPSRAWFAYRYEGDADIHLKSIQLLQEAITPRAQ